MKRTIKEYIYLFFCVVNTKLFFRNCRLIRLPIDIRGKNKITFGNGLTTGYHCRLEDYSSEGNGIIFGNNIQINDFVHIAAKRAVKIDDNVLIASKVFITDIEHGSYKSDENDSNPLEIPKDRKLSANPVHINKNVWIGEMVSVLPGVTIGENSIIGANSVVTKNIPANSIAVGNPAKVIKQYNFEKKIWERV